MNTTLTKLRRIMLRETRDIDRIYHRSMRNRQMISWWILRVIVLFYKKISNNHNSRALNLKMASLHSTICLKNVPNWNPRPHRDPCSLPIILIENRDPHSLLQIRIISYKKIVTWRKNFKSSFSWDRLIKNYQRMKINNQKTIRKLNLIKKGKKKQINWMTCRKQRGQLWIRIGKCWINLR